MQLATRSQRFWAAMVDGIITLAIILFVFMLLVLYILIFGEPEGSPHYRGLLLALTAAYYALYFAVHTHFFMRSQSPGKALLKLKVVDMKTGQPISLKWMLMRECLAKGVSAFLFGAGFWVILRDKQRQGWHDLIAETVVVKLD